MKTSKVERRMNNLEELELSSSINEIILILYIGEFCGMFHDKLPFWHMIFKSKKTVTN